MQIGRGLARGDSQLECSDDARSVARGKASGRDRIETREQGVEILRTSTPDSLNKPGANGRIDDGRFEEPRRQSLQVEAGTSRKNRSAIASLDVLDCRGGRARPVAGGKIHGRINDVDQVVRDAMAIRDRHFCRGDVNSAIDLDRVEVYDLAIQSKRKPDGQVALA